VPCGPRTRRGMNGGVGTGSAQNAQGFAHRHAGHETTVGVPGRDPRLPSWQRKLEDDNTPGQVNRPDPSHLDHGDTVPPTADNRGLSDRGVTLSAQPAHPRRPWRGLTSARWHRSLRSFDAPSPDPQHPVPMGGPAAHRRTATELNPKSLGGPRAVRLHALLHR
jgi:hypothetical protein